jgi:CHAP domain
MVVQSQVAQAIGTTARNFQQADARAIGSMLATARSQIGVRERGNNRTPYGRWYGVDGQAWCAMFVSWVFAHAGRPLPAIDSRRGYALVRDGYRWARAHGRWTRRPQVGDVFFILYGNGQGHTGIVERVNRNGTITTIEGNTNTDGSSNGVGVFRRRRSIRSINGGFMRPIGRVRTIAPAQSRRLVQPANRRGAPARSRRTSRSSSLRRLSGRSSGRVQAAAGRTRRRR